MVAQIVDQEKQSAAVAKASTHLMTASDIDTDTDEDLAEDEYQQWIRRELARVKREEMMRDPAAAKEAQERAAADAPGPAVRPLCCCALQ